MYYSRVIKYINYLLHYNPYEIVYKNIYTSLEYIHDFVYNIYIYMNSTNSYSSFNDNLLELNKYYINLCLRRKKKRMLIQLKRL